VTDISEDFGHSRKNGTPKGPTRPAIFGKVIV
jgi:hypothetical protein